MNAIASCRVITVLACLTWHPEAGAAAVPESLRGDLRVHDPSTIVKCNDEYWLFATGPGIKSRRSKDLVHWEPGPRVLTNLPAWVTRIVPDHRGYFWAPDVIRIDNRFLLYYSVSKWGRNTSAIGLATNATLDPADPKYGWIDQGIVIESAERDNFNAIDPCVTQNAGGDLHLAFGSYWSGIKLVQLDRATGKRVSPNSPMHSLAWHTSIEAACVVRHGDFHYLFVNWGQCCRGTNSTYEIRVGRGRRITGPYLDRDGVDLMRGGGTPFLATTGRFIGPGHAAVLSEAGTHWFSCHYYDGSSRGAATLHLRPLRWDRDGWPVVSLEEPDRPSP